MIIIKNMMLAGALLFTTTFSAHAADVTITVNGRVVAKAPAPYQRHRRR